LTSTLWSWGHKANTLLYRIAERREKGDNSYSIFQEFDINSRVILVGKTSLATTLYAWSPNIDDIREHHQGYIYDITDVEDKSSLTFC
jgi:hypothetical protein